MTVSLQKNISKNDVRICKPGTDALFYTKGLLFVQMSLYRSSIPLLHITCIVKDVLFHDLSALCAELLNAGIYSILNSLHLYMQKNFKSTFAHAIFSFCYAMRLLNTSCCVNQRMLRKRARGTFFAVKSTETIQKRTNMTFVIMVEYQLSETGIQRNILCSPHNTKRALRLPRQTSCPGNEQNGFM